MEQACIITQNEILSYNTPTPNPFAAGNARVEPSFENCRCRSRYFITKSRTSLPETIRNVKVALARNSKTETCFLFTFPTSSRLGINLDVAVANVRSLVFVGSSRDSLDNSFEVVGFLSVTAQMQRSTMYELDAIYL